MTTTTKKPLHASGLARHLSRILRENGFERAEIKRNNFQSEGFVVHRVGYGSSVHVYWHAKGYQPDIDRAREWSKVSQMRELLFELGYDVSSKPHSIYIECQHS